MSHAGLRTLPSLSDRIDVTDPHALVLWAMLFGITAYELIVAIDDAGTKAQDVARHLRIMPDTSSSTRH